MRASRCLPSPSSASRRARSPPASATRSTSHGGRRLAPSSRFGTGRDREPAGAGGSPLGGRGETALAARVDAPRSRAVEGEEEEDEAEERGQLAGKQEGDDAGEQSDHDQEATEQLEHPGDAGERRELHRRTVAVHATEKP